MQTFLASSLHSFNEIRAKKKRLKSYWLRAGKKTLTSSSKSTLKQPLTSQDSNNLWLQASAKFKPPKIPEISVEKLTTHNIQRIPFLLPDKKECSLAY